MLKKAITMTMSHNRSMKCIFPQIQQVQVYKHGRYFLCWNYVNSYSKAWDIKYSQFLPRLKEVIQLKCLQS